MGYIVKQTCGISMLNPTFLESKIVSSFPDSVSLSVACRESLGTRLAKNTGILSTLGVGITSCSGAQVVDVYMKLVLFVHVNMYNL